MNAIDILTVLQLRIAENEIIWTITNETRFFAFSTSSGTFPQKLRKGEGFRGPACGLCVNLVTTLILLLKKLKSNLFEESRGY